MIDIWHTTDEIPDFNKSYVELSRSVQGDLVYSTWGHPNYITKNTIKWCYMDDLLALETKLERTRKALGYAINVIQTVAKMSDKLSRKYGETLVEQLDNIQAYCWQEGYVLTHEEDLERVITALEQKGK